MMKRLYLLTLLSLFCTSLEAKESQGSAIQVKELLKTTTSWDGNQLPAYPEGQPEVTILHITVAPGTALPEHHHPVINAGVLLKGRIIVTLEDGTTKQLEAGDALAEVVGRKHFGRNNGEVPAEIIVVYAGTKGSQITVVDEHPEKH